MDPDDTKTPNQRAFDKFVAQRRSHQTRLPEVLNLPDGAYIAMALLSVTALVVAAWRPGILPLAVVLLPGGLLMIGFAVKCLFFAPWMLYEGAARWRNARKEDAP